MALLELDLDRLHLVFHPGDLQAEPATILQLPMCVLNQLGFGVPAAAQLRRDRVRVQRFVEPISVPDQESLQPGQFTNRQDAVLQGLVDGAHGHKPDGHRAVAAAGDDLWRADEGFALPERGPVDRQWAAKCRRRVEEVEQVEVRWHAAGIAVEGDRRPFAVIDDVGRRGLNPRIERETGILGRGPGRAHQAVSGSSQLGPGYDGDQGERQHGADKQGNPFHLEPPPGERCCTHPEPSD
jgi:hypothetical protein